MQTPISRSAVIFCPSLWVGPTSNCICALVAKPHCALQACLHSRPETHPSLSSWLLVTPAFWRRVNLHSGVHKQPVSSLKATQPLWPLSEIIIRELMNALEQTSHTVTKSTQRNVFKSLIKLPTSLSPVPFLFLCLSFITFYTLCEILLLRHIVV